MGRSLITHITPIPPGISRETAISRLHDHVAMIQLNPLVIRQEATDAPPQATKDEAELGTWYSITDMINYLPGGLYKGEASYKACFYNLKNGIQTHVFAPAGVDIRSKWSIGGNMPDEPREPSELGIDKPREGLYIKEEIDLRCNMFIGAFVKRNLQSSHQEVHNKIIAKAIELEMRLQSALGLEGRSSNHATESNNLVSRAPSSFFGLVSPPADSLRSNQSRELDFSCTCQGTTHTSSCSFFHPGDLQQYDTGQHSQEHHRRSFPYPTVSIPNSTASYFTSPGQAPTTWVHTPSELHGSPAQGQCLCTGGLHDRTCSSYPGLRLPASSSLSDDISSQIPLSLRAGSTDVPRSTGSATAPQRRTYSGFTAQRPGEQAEMSAARSPVDSNSFNFSRPLSISIRPSVQHRLSDRTAV